MVENTPITVAYGDGIGPEIMEATLGILRYADAKITVETIEVGEKMYKKTYSSGICPDSWSTIKKNKVILKAPITTPQGGGCKSLNVTMRKTLGLYANVRPCVSYAPFVETKHPDMDVVIVRENEEDLYAGIEYRLTNNSFQTIKLISRTGSEKIVRYAFEYAVKNNRKKVTCFSKDNIMKMSDGIFHEVFDEVAKEYPEIENEHYIIDIGTARLATRPEIFDVIVTLNLYGDIISDITAELSGSVGLAGSANIGTEYAMFEAIHGSAPDIAGQNIANPSGLLHGAIMMLNHIGQAKVAENIHNAWLKTIEEGVHTADIYKENVSTKKVGTMEFADEVISRLGQKPQKYLPVEYKEGDTGHKYDPKHIELRKEEKKVLVGVDIYLDWSGSGSEELAAKINEHLNGKLKLQMISCRGLKVWPQSEAVNINEDLWRLRFSEEGAKITGHSDILSLMSNLNDNGFEVVKTENLFSYDDKIGFSLSQGE